jgi:hypothetical protein
VNRRLVAVLVVALLVAAACGGGGDAPPADDGALQLDPCSLLTEGVASDLVGAEVTPTTGQSAGQALACSYAARDASGGDAGRSLASLVVEEQDDGKTTAEIVSDVREQLPEALPTDVGDAGFVVRTEDSVQVVYVVRTVVVRVDITPADGEVSDEKVTAVLEFSDSTVKPVTDAVDASGVGGPGTVVQAHDNVYLALETEEPEDELLGTIPPSIDLGGAGLRGTVRFQVTGSTDCCGSLPASPPDGHVAPSVIRGINGIAGFSADRALPLVGVFIGDEPPEQPEGEADEQQLEATAAVSPALGVPFLIGDGTAGTGTDDEAPLVVTIPDGAVRLVLGFADGFGFGGDPATYQDNSGAVRVRVSS